MIQGNYNMNELERLKKLAGIVTESPQELDEYRRKKPDAGKSHIDSQDDITDVGFSGRQESDFSDEDEKFYADFNKKHRVKAKSPMDDMAGDELDSLGLDSFDDIIGGREHSMMDAADPRLDPELKGEEDFEINDFDDDTERMIDVGDELEPSSDYDDIEDILGIGAGGYSESADMEVDEVMSCDDPASDWIKDFQQSDDERFKGDSQDKRKERALGAYYGQCKEDEMEEGGNFLSPEEAAEYADEVNEEESELDNGYRNTKTHDVDTLFPDGHHGVASQKVGPSAARHGDNALYAGIKESLKESYYKKYKK